MIKQKSDKCSVTFKNSGNGYFKQSKFEEALVEYNKALNYAVSKENQAFAYANRSAAYLEMKKYQKCLQNIQWALENEYPSDKVQKLLERKAKCEELMQKGKSKDEKREDEMREFFKLSYPANPKIPFIIDGLELRMTEKMGRGIFTTRDLKPGDIISIEEPILTTMDEGCEYNRCCNCLASHSFNLIPCLKTASLMFCSIKCREDVYAKIKPQNYHCLIDYNVSTLFTKIQDNFEHALGGRENFMKFIRNLNFKTWNKTIFDYDFSNPNDPEYKANIMKSVISYVSERYNTIKDEDAPAIEETMKGNSILKKFLVHMDVVWRSSVVAEHQCKIIGNSLYQHPILHHSISRAFGTALYRLNLFSPLMNYSCYPNIQRVITENRVFMYVARPIKAGEELFRGVVDSEMFQHSVLERRNFILTNNYFSCKCYYCENGINVDGLPKNYKPLPDKTGNAMDTVMKHFKFIEKYEEEDFAHGCFESYLMNILNHRLLNALAYDVEY